MWQWDDDLDAIMSAPGRAADEEEPEAHYFDMEDFEAYSWDLCAAAHGPQGGDHGGGGSSSGPSTLEMVASHSHLEGAVRVVVPRSGDWGTFRPHLGRWQKITHELFPQ